MADDLRDFFEGELVFNGVNAITGNYGQPPLSSRELARLIRGEPLPSDYRSFVERQKRLADLAHVEERLERVTDAQAELRARAHEVRLNELRFKAQAQTAWPVIPGAGDPTEIKNVGWAVLFSSEMHPGIREEIKRALQPLTDLRREQAGDLFRLLDGTGAYRPAERKDQYFERMGVGPGLADPRELPFYVMIVGTPEQIPYSFQYQLDVMRGVGRLDFGSDIEAYAAYARTVVAAERGEISVPRRTAFWAPTNQGDKATEMSRRLLVQPLFENLAAAASGTPAQGDAPDLDIRMAYDWQVIAPNAGADYATRAKLTDLLGGDPNQRPGLLFTASHGVEFPANHTSQIQEQGALLCQDWPGAGSAVLRDHYFAADDVDRHANLSGMMAVFFACYSAGTPQLDQFAAQAFNVREKIAPLSFTAALPQRLLKQGALAVLGHVERAWGYSFISPQGRLDNQAFVTAMRLLMNGERVGVATDASFNMRYAEMSSDLSADLDELKWNPSYLSEHELIYRWTANNDARSYVVIGDPAVRLPMVGRDGQPVYAADLGTVFESEAESEEPADEGASSVVETAYQPTDEGGLEPPWPDEGPEPVSDVEDVEAPGDTVAPFAHLESAPPQVAATAAPDVVPEPSAPSAETTRQAARAWETSQVPLTPMVPPRPEAAIGYGLEDQFEKLKTSLKAFTDQLAISLGNAADDIVTLDVRTYSTADIEAVAKALDSHEELDAKLRALTRVAFDGDLQVYVPERPDRSVDEAMWIIHKAMVEEAQRSRAGFLATMAELATRLMDALKIGF